MSWLDCTLGHGVRNQEEVEFAVDDFRLLNESLVHVGTLRWVLDVSSTDFEEPLSDSLVNDGESDIRDLGLSTVLVSEDLLELLKFVLDDLLSH